MGLLDRIAPASHKLQLMVMPGSWTKGQHGTNYILVVNGKANLLSNRKVAKDFIKEHKPDLMHTKRFTSGPDKGKIYYALWEFSFNLNKPF